MNNMANLANMARGLSRSIDRAASSRGVTKKSIYLSISTAGLTDKETCRAILAICAALLIKQAPCQ